MMCVLLSALVPRRRIVCPSVPYLCFSRLFLIIVAARLIPTPSDVAAQVIIEIIDKSGAGVGKILDDPKGIAVNSFTGNVYVAGRNSDNAFKITPAGVITQIIDSTGDGAGELIDYQYPPD